MIFKGLIQETRVIDLNSVGLFGHTAASFLDEEMADESRKTIFAQLMDFLPTREFRRCVERYQGHYKVLSFSCFRSISVLGVCSTELSRISARYRSVSAAAEGSKLYHLGIRSPVSRNTLAHANPSQADDWCLFADFAYCLFDLKSEISNLRSALGNGIMNRLLRFHHRNPKIEFFVRP